MVTKHGQHLSGSRLNHGMTIANYDWAMIHGWIFAGVSFPPQKTYFKKGGRVEGCLSLCSIDISDDKKT